MECSPVQWVVLSAKCFAQMSFEYSSNTRIVDIYIPTVITPLPGKGSKLLDTITATIASKSTDALPFNMQYLILFLINCV